MTIEEKRRVLAYHCTNTSCDECALADRKHNWKKPCGETGNRPCLWVSRSPEEDLDKALAIIGYVEETQDGLKAEIVMVDELHKDDPVNHPSHYTDGKIEVIDFIADKKLGFCLGNAVKYISRAGKKDPGKTIEDLEKAIWYIKHHIKTLEEVQNG